ARCRRRSRCRARSIGKSGRGNSRSDRAWRGASSHRAVRHGVRTPPAYSDMGLREGLQQAVETIRGKRSRPGPPPFDGSGRLEAFASVCPAEAQTAFPAWACFRSKVRSVRANPERSRGASGGCRWTRRARRQRLLHRSGDQAFADGQLAGGLAGAANGFGLFASPLFGRFFIRATRAHLTEHAFALHFLLQDPERLIDIVVTYENLQWLSFFCLAPAEKIKGASPKRLRRPLLSRYR